jgi:hypothetical protein
MDKEKIMRRIGIFIFLIVLFLLATGCSTPPVEEPTEVPKPPTVTPVPPTPTPTPIPYDLSVSVLDAEGSPIAGAEAAIDGKSDVTADDGSANWMNLPQESVSVSIAAPGYFPAEVNHTLERGPNQVEIVMELDPEGLLPVNACGPGEVPIYLDDFQDGMAQGWSDIENGAPGWSLEPDPENPEDQVMAARAGAGWAWLGDQDTYNLNNAVWRMRFKQSGNGQGHINFRFVESPDFTSRYILGLSEHNTNVIRWQPTNEFDIGMGQTPQMDTWHLMEFSYFDGTVMLYIDKKEVMSWEEPNPWEGGSVNLEPYMQNDGVIFYDDMSLCVLTAPFETIPRPSTGYNLAATISDAEGNAIPDVKISVSEMGALDEATMMTDDAGIAVWTDVPAGSATLLIDAPGYFAAEEIVALEKGDNETSLTLERDEFGRLVSQSCRTEETYIYAEDIQDGKMQGWNQLTSAIEMGVPGVSIITDPEQEGNTLLKFEGMSDNQHSNPQGYDQSMFGDAVLRFDIQSFGNMHHIVGWHRNDQSGDPSYMLFIYGGNDRGGRLVKDLGGGNHVDILSWNRYIGGGLWHTFEISTYQGEFQLWIDGRLMNQWTDQQPVEEGYFTIEHDFWKAGSVAHYDNFSVCGLNAPFVSIFAEE